MEISAMYDNQLTIFRINNFKTLFGQLTSFKIKYCDCNRKF